MNRNIVLIILSFFLISCKQENQSNGGWQLVFKNNEKGQTKFGDKSKLIDAVRLGYPVRIGWGGNRVEHIANADFLTIFEGKEVFAQINTVVGQEPRIDGDSMKIRFRIQNHWTKIAGTNGYSTCFMTNYFQDTLAGGGMDRYSTTAWYVLYPGKQSVIEPFPLWRKESPNWEKWNENNEKD